MQILVAALGQREIEVEGTPLARVALAGSSLGRLRGITPGQPERKGGGGERRAAPWRNSRREIPDVIEAQRRFFLDGWTNRLTSRGLWARRINPIHLRYWGRSECGLVIL